MKVKYPRTPHVPFSPGKSSDDKTISSLDQFFDRDVVVTEKMDGENTTLYRDGFHARSLDSRHHHSRDWVKRFHSTIAYKIPEGWRICGENMYARHSIEYENLDSYFLAFSVWNEDNVCLEWDETVTFLKSIGVKTVPVAFVGKYYDTLIESAVGQIDTNMIEGVVIRVKDSFSYDQFGNVCAKWVRPNHVITEEHWMNQKIIPNKIKEK